MTPILEIIILILVYLWGSIPYGYIITRIYSGKNILEQGSGNIGSTNVGRIAGKKMSFLTQILDMLKGLVPVAVYMHFQGIPVNTPAPIFLYLIALTTIIGHNSSVFLKFKGGKGVNTTLGASVLVAPYSVFISIFVYFLVKWKFKYVSLGSLFLGVTLPVVEIIIHRLSFTFYYLLICTLLIIIRHRKNIDRLLHNRELL
jgi:acyl phosphate:glycerol-3-phosphate acyltransferase